MEKLCRFLTCFALLLMCVPVFTYSQEKPSDGVPQLKILAAGEEYDKKEKYKWFWGSNYRNIWATPVAMPTLNMKTAYGGLTAYKADTNAAEKTLYLKNSDGKEFVLISVNRKPGKLLPPMFRNTYFETRLNDEVSITHPYAAATMPVMEGAAKIYAPDVAYYFVPQQDGLNIYNEDYGNGFYKLALLPGHNNVKDNRHDSTNIISTAELIEVLKNNGNKRIDVNAFLRERLFDMFVNDWNRGEEQWQWLATTNGDKTMFSPLPALRDAAYTKYNGKFTRLAFALSQKNYVQPFADNIKDVNKFNFKAKNIDRFLLNETTLSDWQTAAKELQQALTDAVIEEAINQLPKEVYTLSANELISKLKERRRHLVEWATEYYMFLSAEVEVAGSYQNDEFIVQYNGDEVTVNVFSFNNGQQAGSPYYSRTFKTSETNEIRLFGLGGDDKYVISGDANAIKIKISDGINNDTIDASALNKTSGIVVYGSKDNIYAKGQTHVKVVGDTTFKSFNYNWFNYNKSGLAPIIFYSMEDRLFVGLAYTMRRNKWGKNPYASNQSFAVHYSLLENAFSVAYKADFPNLIAKSNFSLYINYDVVRWNFFFGMGNDTKFNQVHKLEYYTMRTRQWTVQPALTRKFGKNSVAVFINFNGVKIINDTARFIRKVFKPEESLFKWNSFIGGGISYSYECLNDNLIPTKGVYFNATAGGTQSITTSASYNFSYAAKAHFYVPLVSKFSLNLRAGAQTITGNPEFYQYPSLGGVIFRGVVTGRFTGKTVFYNTNDLRFISPVHTKFFVGKAGLQVFVDNGRVWLPGENSNTWHVAYGGGIILAPFKIANVDFNYGRMGNESSVQVRAMFFIP